MGAGSDPHPHRDNPYRWWDFYRWARYRWGICPDCGVARRDLIYFWTYWLWYKWKWKLRGTNNGTSYR